MIREATGARLAVVAALLAIVGCDEGSPAAPGPPPLRIEGTWTGTLTDRSGLSGQLTMTASGIEPNAFGSFTLSFADASHDVRGLVYGSTIDVPTVNLTFNIQSAGASCQGLPGVFYQARLALDRNRLSGNYQPLFACALLSEGSIEVTRR